MKAIGAVPIGIIICNRYMIFVEILRGERV